MTQPGDDFIPAFGRQCFGVWATKDSVTGRIHVEVGGIGEDDASAFFWVDNEKDVEPKAILKVVESQGIEEGGFDLNIKWNEAG